MNHMPQNKVLPVANTWEKMEDLIFVQDGAPLHFAIAVSE